MSIEPLSLLTFDAAHAQHPYLNTPRSIEACRICGVQPVELVEIRIEQFRKDFPDDPDAAQRRYERIDGARRRILSEVLAEWCNLRDSGWSPAFKKPIRSGEAIIDVPEEAHCTLLELQASRFRKIEQGNMKAFQRMLQVELKTAAEEIRHKKIVEKHLEKERQTQFQKQNNRALIDAMYQEQIKDRQRKELEQEEELKNLKKLTQDELRRKKMDEDQRKVQERFYREEKEMNRVQQMEFTKGKRMYIVNKLDTMFDQRKIIQEKRDEAANEKVRNDRAYRDQQIAVQKDALEQKIAKAKADKEKRDQEKTDEFMQKIAESETKMQKAAEMLQQRSLSRNKSSDTDLQERLRRSKEIGESIVQEKSLKVQAELQVKELMCRQQISRVQEAQERRRTIKMIRQEAFQLAALRKKKTDEYKLQQIEQAIQLKNARSDAIKQGYQTLEVMRREIAHSMHRTRDGMKEELALLNKKDILSPELVVEKAISVTDTLLFPKLARKFTDKSSPPRLGPPRSAATRPETSSSFLTEQGNEQRQLDDGYDSNGGFDAGRSPVHFSAYIAADGSESSIGPMEEELRGRRPGTAPAPSVQMNVPRGRPADSVEGSASPSARAGSAGRHHRGPSKERTVSLSLQVLTKDTLAINVEKSKIWVMKHMEEEENSKRIEKPTKKQAMSSNMAAHGGMGQLPAGQVSSEQPSQSSASHSSGGNSAFGQDYNAKMLAQSNQPASRATDSQDPHQLFPLYNYSMHMGKDDDFSLGGSLSAGSASASGMGEAFPSSESLGTGSASQSQRGLRDGSSSTASGATQSRTRATVESSRKSAAKFLPSAENEFRREFSTDHPLAGGKGKYEKELKGGKKATATHIFGDGKPPPATREIERLTFAVQTMVVDPEQQLDQLRREQNAALLRVLEEERKAEDEREQALSHLTDDKERHRVELLFAEERRAASERIIRLTKEHDIRIREAVVKMMELGAQKGAAASRS